MKEKKTTNGRRENSERLKIKLDKFMPMLNELSVMLYEERLRENIDMVKTSHCEIYFKF